MQRVLHMKFEDFFYYFLFCVIIMMLFINRRRRTCSVLCFKFKWNKKKTKTKIVRSINYETITKCSCHRLLLHHQCYFLQMLQFKERLFKAHKY